MHSADILNLRPKELDRVTVIRRYKAGDITQIEAARTLKLSERHTRRLIRRYEQLGAIGLVNQRQGKKPSNYICPQIKAKALTFIKEYFYDYGPTLAAEKLFEYFDIETSKETVRQWLIEDNLWQPKQKKAPKPHPPRPRRAFLGELIQIDGSYHNWFEDRGPKACLLVFIDDATGRLMNLRFAEAETTIDYLDAFKEYVQKHGVPRATYFDKHNVFHINHKMTKAKDGVTQFGRVLKELDVTPIYAHSPQAKGRVERVNETLQDRLVKEFRFFNINSIDAANEHIKGFINRFNQQFAKKARAPLDLHRALSTKEQFNLDYMFSIQNTKTVSKDFLIRHNKQLIKVLPPDNKLRRFIKQKVTLCEDKRGMHIYYRGKPLEFIIQKAKLHTGPTLNRKCVDQYLDIIANLDKGITTTQ